MKSKIITIIGGTGQMGQLFSRLWQNNGFIVNTIGRKNWDSSLEVISSSDAIIICVPIHDTTKMIKKVSSIISKSVILADFTSIKTLPLITMLATHDGPVVGLHPMFGPTISSAHSQVIVKCDGRYPKQYAWLIDSLKELDFTIKEMDAEKHDQAMNFIQGVEHFLTFSLGTFLHHKQEHPSELMEIASPIYSAKLMLMGRIFDQDPELYADIIMADNTRLSLIREFACWLNDWVNQLEKYNKAEFITEFTKASNWMGEFTSRAQKISDSFLTLDTK